VKSSNRPARGKVRVRISWKIWILIASVLIHAVFIATLKIPELASTVSHAAIVFNLAELPETISQPLPSEVSEVVAANQSDENKNKGTDGISAGTSKSEGGDSSAPPPPSPYAPAPLSSDLIDDGRPVVNPDAGGTPEGEQGGVPDGVDGGTPGGTGNGSGTGDGGSDSSVAPNPPEVKPEPEPEPQVDVKAIQNEYVASVKSKIYGCKFYPEQAERMEREGSVKVRFTVSGVGSVSGVNVESSSGFDDLDSAAMQAVKNAAPFTAIPEELGKSSLTISITLKYYLK
jgi:TonB family protein